MSRLLRSLLIIAGAFIALAAVAVVVLLQRVDPDRYRVAIEEAVFQASGLELDIAGDLALSYQPYLAVMLNDLRLRNPARPQELASAPRISLRVNPRELLRGSLVVEELHAEDLHLNYYVDTSGESLWQTDRLSQPPATRGSEEGPVTVRLNFLSVTDASIDIQNLQRGYYYTVRDLDLASQDSNLAGRPFELQTTFELIDPSAPRPWPMTFASRNRLDRQAGAVSIDSIRLGLTPALVQGELVLRDLYDAGSWQARLTTSEFALDTLLENLLLPEDQQQAPSLPGMRQDPAWQTRWQLSLDGDSQGIRLSELAATLGNMALEMNAEVRFANGLLPANTRFTIDTGALDLSPYVAEARLPPADPGNGPEPTGDDAEDATLLDRLVIPDSLRSGMNMQGSITLGSLFMGGVQFGTVNLFANLESGVLDVELQPTAVLDGSLEGHLRVNTVPARSEMSTEFFATGLNLANLDLPLLEPGTVTGRLSQESRYAGSGTSVGDWLDNIRGATSFVVTDSLVDIGVIKQVFTAIAVLSPRGEAIQSWPDAIRVQEFSGYAIAEAGLRAGQQVKVRMDNFDISGGGGIDLEGRRFEYTLLFTVLGEPFTQTIPVSPDYFNVSWPVQCSAGFDEPINRFCRPDLVQVRDIFGQLGSGSLQYRLEEILSEQPPPALSSSTRGLLQQLFPNQPAPAGEQASPDSGPIEDQALPGPDNITDQPLPNSPGAF